MFVICFAHKGDSYLKIFTLTLACASTFLILLFIAVPVHAGCDECKDLCGLMDVYMQREKGIEIWKEYAASTPDEEKGRYSSYLKNTQEIEDFAMSEFQDWTNNRKGNNQLPCQPTGTGGGVKADLVTDTSNPSCQIYRAFYEGKDSQGKDKYTYEKLEGDTRKKFEDDVGCKALSDAVIEHEKVHQRHCWNAYEQGGESAAKFLDTAEVVAESELQAWTKHKEVVEDQIRKIISEKGCGWDPTERQKNDPNSIPSLKQMQDMEKRGWKAANALSGNK
jgi:hypothetical protein